MSVTWTAAATSTESWNKATSTNKNRLSAFQPGAFQTGAFQSFAWASQVSAVEAWTNK